MIYALTLASLLLFGCGGGAATLSVQQESPEPAPVAATEERTVSVMWSETAATPGCFFFSGPPVPGAEVRDVHGSSATLREASGTLSLDFGGDAVFRGPADDARIVREETYDYRGKWGITETIAFDVVGDGQWRGRYTYEECQTDSNDACPSRCRIDATIALD
jgi:hypothetical protein